MPLSNSFEDMSYTGRDGLSRQSTLLSYEDKTKVATTVKLSSEELSTILGSQELFRRSLIERILAINPALAGERYEPFINRLVKERRLEWNIRMIADPGIPTDQLRDMVTILENRNGS